MRKQMGMRNMTLFMVSKKSSSRLKGAHGPAARKEVFLVEIEL